ncbi:hypothetical protein ANCCEY_00471 [Ancylostoma ceylanicum]|uniref:Uncharacterized protein n=1 Tax=Ancylostoma ceylanicum TaxID=53326 RepID=A0A0D6M8B5_9BILA|nr:hypothetical protein ANCCEY_00471 [Ancylostoma ceylanicum]
MLNSTQYVLEHVTTSRSASCRNDITPAIVTDYLADDIVEKSTTDKDPFDTCVLPNYDPWDEHVIPYVDQNYNPLKGCNHNFKPMTALKRGIVTVNAKDVSCVGRCLTRSTDLYNNRGQWLDVTKTKFFCDVVETLCTDANGKDVYQMVHAQIIEKKEPESHKNKTKQKNQGYYNIYVILLDSISATQGTRNSPPAHSRHLPQTLQFFEKSMEAVSFPHINKIGLNSRPNGVALWFGKSMEKVHRKLFGLPDIEPDWTFIEFCRRFVDNETFLMKEFSESGYKTLLAEDWMLGTLNYPNCRGFKKQPTDHYMRPFQIALELNATNLLTATYNYTNCIEQHQDILGYLQDFVNSYKVASLFRCPRNQCDPEPAVVLRLEHWRSTDLKANEEITHTRLGSLELNNPMFLISVPKKLRKSTDILSILRENAARLQTPYDIRATFLDILKYQPSSNFTDRSSMTLSGEYGVSFLRTQPDVERTSSPMAVEAGKFLITYINSFLEQYDTSHKCETLEFSHTISMFAYVPEELTKTYRISVKATPPSNAEFREHLTIFDDSVNRSGVQNIQKEAPKSLKSQTEPRSKLITSSLNIQREAEDTLLETAISLTSIDEFRSAGSTDYVTGESSTYASLDDTTETPAAKLNPFDTCILPEYDPWDEDIVPNDLEREIPNPSLQFVDQEYNPLNNCNRKFKPMTTLKDGIVTVNAENVTCQGRCLTRRSDRANNRGRWVNVDEADFRCEIVETLCTDTTGKDVYQMVHAQVVEKNDTKLYKGNARSENYHNVYVILLDSISSTQGTRSLQTLLAEDWGQGTLNWPSCKGFNKQPTDHYMSRFTISLLAEAQRSIARGRVAARAVEKYGLITNGELDDSFVIILGDHGLRGGRVTHTKLGSLEVNNPMFSISVPKKLRKSTNILSILRENSVRLQTHYDIRATLLDILKYQPSSNFTDRSYVAFNGEYGTSLLRTQPDEERTCKNLPIPISYCTCQFPLEDVKRRQEGGKGNEL